MFFNNNNHNTVLGRKITHLFTNSQKSEYLWKKYGMETLYIKKIKEDLAK